MWLGGGGVGKVVGEERGAAPARCVGEVVS
jgi:hypothetical protein